MKKTTRRILKEVRRVSTMETADFGRLDDILPITLNSRQDVDNFVKSHIELWLESWITRPLDKVLTEEK